MTGCEDTKLLEHFSLSAIGERPWEDTLHEIGDRFRSSVALAAVADTAGTPHSFGVHGYTIDEVVTFFHSEPWHKGWVPTYAQLPLGTVYFNHMTPELEHNHWFRECLRVLRARYQMGIKLSLPDGSVGALTCLRTSDEGHPEEDVIDTLRRMGPAMEQAYALGFLVEREAVTREALLQALALRADGVILLDAGRHLVFANEQAAAILRGGDGLAHCNGEFVTARSVETRLLNRMIGASVEAVRNPVACRTQRRVLIVRPSGKQPYVVHVHSAPPSDRFLTVNAIACVVHIQDLESSLHISREALQSLFGLTERESDLVTQLVTYMDLKVAAAAAGMAVNTARTHLQSVFRKSSTSSQIQLVQLCSRLT